MVKKACIITGGAKGIGRVLTENLLIEGYSVLIFDRDLKSAEETYKELKEKHKTGDDLEVFVGDVTSSDDIKNMTDICLKKFGSIDALINNAGLYHIKDIFTEEVSEWDNMIDVNLKGIFLCCKAVLGYMKKKKKGKIINFSSISGKKQSIFASPSYCASKAGVIGLTRCIAAQVARYNININCIAPGAIGTEMLTKNLTEEQILKAKDLIPLRRMGRPEDIAGAVKFLLSSGSDFITGETINVNGGSFME